AVAQGARSARGDGAADGRAVPGLCRGRHHGRDPRRQTRDHSGRDAGEARRASRPRAGRGNGAMTAKEEIETVRVELGTRGYDILIGDGLIARAGAEIAARLPGSRAAIVTDENLARHHAPALAASLEAAGIASTTI